MPRTKKKVKPIVKTKVISARVTEVVHDLLHRQAEDAGMTLSEFAAQMLMKGSVNISYVFYVCHLYTSFSTRGIQLGWLMKFSRCDVTL